MRVDNKKLLISLAKDVLEVAKIENHHDFLNIVISNGTIMIHSSEGQESKVDIYIYPNGRIVDMSR